MYDLVLQSAVLSYGSHATYLARLVQFRICKLQHINPLNYLHTNVNQVGGTISETIKGNKCHSCAAAAQGFAVNLRALNLIDKEMGIYIAIN